MEYIVAVCVVVIIALGILVACLFGLLSEVKQVVERLHFDAEITERRLFKIEERMKNPAKIIYSDEAR